MANVIKKTPAVEKDAFFKRIAMFSIGLYLVFSTVFDEVASGLSVLSSVSIYFCLGCCALYVLARGTFRLNYMMVILLAVGVLLVISTVYSPTAETVVNRYLYRYWTSSILVILISNTVTSLKDVDKVITCYVLAGVAISLYMYSLYGISNLVASLGRLDTQLGNQNGVGMSCAFAIIFAVCKFVKAKGYLKILYAVAAVVCMPAVMFTGSRKSILILMVAFVVFVLFYSENKNFIKNVLLGIVLIGIVIWAIYYIPAFEVIKTRFEATFNFLGGNTTTVDVGDANRMRYLEQGIKVFLENPFFGAGFCSSHYYFGVYSHNNFIELLMNGGLALFLTFYSMYALSFILNMKYRRNIPRFYFAIAITILAMILTADIGVVTYYERVTLIAMSLCVAIAQAAKKGDDSE